MEGYLGVIQALGFSFAPRYWSLCNGALISISQNSALFSLLGDNFGGDGRVSFGLPEMRGRAPIGHGQGPGLQSRVIGQRPGVESITLNSTHLPAHTHTHSYTGGGSGGAIDTTVEVANTHGTKPAADDHYLAMPSNALGTSTNGFMFVTEAEATTAGVVALGGVSGSGGGTFNPQALTINTAGASRSFELVQPSIGINFSICVQGQFPSRS
ncbi:phage tail protein [Kordiimonas aestuarii]|uniref:phage tail protein n=1 Tax=Kordiimonas aestuarii TaxID=1005925 RepID=UPI0021D39A84|nr:tail fiber protein [Kordiimonas aestuarii]